jgi:hypothetical protein
VPGARFTRALLPRARLLVDDFDVDQILAKFDNFPGIKRVLNRETEKQSSGRIDKYSPGFLIEALTSRCFGMVRRSHIPKAGALFGATSRLAPKFPHSGRPLSLSFDS